MKISEIPEPYKGQTKFYVTHSSVWCDYSIEIKNCSYSELMEYVKDKKTVVSWGRAL